MNISTTWQNKLFTKEESWKKTEWQKVSRPIETAFQKLLIIGHEIATIYYQWMHLLIWKPISFQDMHLRK